jgi:hypothetical protein
VPLTRPDATRRDVPVRAGERHAAARRNHLTRQLPADRIGKHGDYAAAGIPFYLRVDLENGIEALEATLYQLVDGEYREAARSGDGVLRSSLPWPFEIDLRAMATGCPLRAGSRGAPATAAG